MVTKLKSKNYTKIFSKNLRNQIRHQKIIHNYRLYNSTETSDVKKTRHKNN